MQKRGTTKFVLKLGEIEKKRTPEEYGGRNTENEELI